MLQKGNIYYNYNSLNLGFMVNKEILNYENKTQNETLNPFKYQNILFEQMTNSDKVYFKEYDNNQLYYNTYNYKIDNEQDIYCYLGVDFLD